MFNVFNYAILRAIIGCHCFLGAMVGDVNLFLMETDSAEESGGPATSAEVEVMIAGEETDT